jgi:ornithine--oxo-acid transaminase
MTSLPASAAAISRDESFSAPNYHPLPIVAATAEGVWITDVDGNRYLDMLSAYSALNFGHRHPALVAAAERQLGLVTLTSRAMHNDQFGPFAEELADLCGMDMVLPMNTGAEAVETAVKTARKWGYDVKGIGQDRARIVVCGDNFHGRTTTIVSFSTDPTAREGFGPFTPGFVTVPYGDSAALAAVLAADPDVVAFLVEPVQGEAGVVVPPEGYLREVRELCTKHRVLMIADEIQSGFGRTGTTFACQHEDVQPDMYLLGKALGGGIVALSAVVSRRDILGVLTAGTHGSTFGGNPLACAIGRAVLGLLRSGEFQERSRVLGARMLDRLRAADVPAITEVRGKGLWAGVVLAEEAGPARGYCERMLGRGVVCKDTQRTTLRLAPPLVISEEELDWALDRVLGVLGEGPAA